MDPLSSARIDLRLPMQTKSLISSAAKAAGFRSVSEFIVQAALEKVDAVATRERLIQLSPAAQAQVLTLLSATRENDSANNLLNRESKFNINDKTKP